MEMAGILQAVLNVDLATRDEKVNSERWESWDHPHPLRNDTSVAIAKQAKVCENTSQRHHTTLRHDHFQATRRPRPWWANQISVGVGRLAHHPLVLFVCCLRTNQGVEQSGGERATTISVCVFKG